MIVCFEGERKREVEIFKICRDYEEFMERLGVEMACNEYSKNLPCNKSEVVGDDVDLSLIHISGSLKLPNNKLAN